MTGPGRDADSDIVGRTLCDIAQVLESAQGAEGRVRAALELLGKVVPFRQCALLEAEPGCDPRLTTLPELIAEERNGLANALVKLLGKMLEERVLEPAPLPISWAAHLAVPLIGLEEVIGVLFVRRQEGPYERRHLRVLSLVAAQLAAFLMMLRARAEEVGRAQELEEARCTAESAQRARDQLVELIAHELTTPVAAAMSWVRLLGSPDLSSAERARAVEVIERAVRGRDLLVSDLLGLSTMTKETSLAPGPVDSARSIEAAIEVLRPLAAQRSIRLEATLDPGVGPVIADSGRLDAVLAVLLANAFNLTPDGGSVQVGLDAIEARVRIRVSNSGRGLAADRLQHVFQGLGAPEARSKGSLGIGLAMARYMIELHGGTIRAESPGEDQGATLTVELPQSSPQVAPPS